MEQTLDAAITKYFDRFAFFGGTPGTVLSPVSTIEMQTGKENRSLTEQFENDPALRYMEKRGWVHMPGGREAILTTEGSTELRQC